MNILLDYMIKNEGKFLKYATNITKNREAAKDLVQRTYLYFLENPKTDIKCPTAYIFFALTGRYVNHFYKYQKRMKNIHRSLINDEGENLLENSPNNDFEKMENNIDYVKKLNKVLDIVDKECSNKEREALYHVLYTDDMTKGINGGSFETLKANRRLAIKRVQKYLNENSLNS